LDFLVDLYALYSLGVLGVRSLVSTPVKNEPWGILRCTAPRGVATGAILPALVLATLASYFKLSITAPGPYSTFKLLTFSWAKCGATNS